MGSSRLCSSRLCSTKLCSSGMCLIVSAVNARGSQSCQMIETSPGLLPCRSILHVVGQNDPAKIKHTVYSVLKVCEENKSKSVSFPALGTGL